ncbi:MAG TPA: hypothetical protein PKE12_10795 [Kiritimatiellia bacterium]|nr:hypothetical protein [Kiritimatiellia bacterium]
MRRVVDILLLLAFLCVSNAHLPVLQVMAWTGMLVSYSQDRSFAEAAEMTFDGEHPCPMCTAIKKQQVEEKADFQAPDSAPRLHWIVDAPPGWLHALNPLHRCPLVFSACDRMPVQPERQPPRTNA